MDGDLKKPSRKYPRPKPTAGGRAEFSLLTAVSFPRKRESSIRSLLVPRRSLPRTLIRGGDDNTPAPVYEEAGQVHGRLLLAVPYW